MEQMEIFDNILKQYESYRMLGSKIIKYMFVVIGCVLMLLPPSTEFYVLVIICMLSWAVLANLIPYMSITDGKHGLNIYSVLKHTPIDKKVFVRSRIKVHLNYMSKLSIVLFIMKVIGSIGFFGIDLNTFFYDIIYVAVVAAVLVVIGILYVIWSAKS